MGIYTPPLTQSQLELAAASLLPSLWKELTNSIDSDMHIAFILQQILQLWGHVTKMHESQVL